MKKLLVIFLISTTVLAKESCESIMTSESLSKQDISLRRAKEPNQILTFKQKIYFLCSQTTEDTIYNIKDGGIKLPDNYVAANTIVKEKDGTIKLININER